MQRSTIPVVLSLCVLFSAPAFADPPAGYYDSVDPSDAAALRLSLHDLIDDHTRYPYTSSSTDVWDILNLADQDPADSGHILDLYKNASYQKISGGTGAYNREHSWPKSYGFPDDNSSNYPYTDCHHLFACDSSYNSSRSNKPFRDCVNCSEKPTDGGGTGVYPGNSNWTEGSGDTGGWETWIGRRGDVARAAFYMAIRYEGGNHGTTGANEPDLELTNNTSLIASSSTGNNESVAYMGLLSDLIAWHNQDPVDAKEMHRNDVVSSFQGNRNPFIDHPEWVACVFLGECDGTPPAGNELDNGVAKSNLSAAQGDELQYVMQVPSGASNLSFQIAGGSGDADLYVKFGSAPTTSSYDCRPYKSGNSEECTFASPSSGTYHVMLRAYNAFSGVNLVGSYDTGPGNTPPTAGFTYAASDLSVAFSDTSFDSDGSVISWNWDFGDGSHSSSQNPSHSYAAGGTYTVSLTVGDNLGATDSHSMSVTVSEPVSGPTELANGVAVSNLAAAKSGELHYFVNVPSGASNLRVQISAGSGDADLYVRYGSAPTTSSYDYRPYLGGNNETVDVASPSSGTWYVMVRAYAAFSGVNLVASYDQASGNTAPVANFNCAAGELSVSCTDSSADANGSIVAWSWSFGDGGSSTSQNPSHTYGAGGTYTVSLTVTDNDGASDSYSTSVTVSEPGGSAGELANGDTVAGLAAAQGEELHYWIEVPQGVSNLGFQISGGSGDGDLYVRYGSAPTTSSWDHRPYLYGNNESVNVSSPVAGTWYVMVRAYSAFSGVNLVASFDGGGSAATAGPQTAVVDGAVAGRASEYFDVTVSGGQIDLSLNWDNTMDLDLYLYDPSGAIAASGTSTNTPETFSFDTNGVSGTYQIRVFNYSYDTSTVNNYALSVTYEP